MSLDLLDPFRKSKEAPKRSWEILFTGPNGGRGGGGGGGAGAKQKAEADAALELETEAEEEFKKADKVKDPVLAPKPAVRLFNPKWQGSRGVFNEKIIASLEGEIPPGSDHLTRVSFTVHAILPNGKLERIDAQDAHIRDGKAMVELTLWTPNFRDEGGKCLKECEYAFKAKHRDSKEIESDKLKGGLKGAPKATSPYYLRIHMNPEVAKKLEEKFILSSADGSFSQARTADDDLIQGDDFIDLRFTEVPVDLAYSMKIEAEAIPPYFVFRDVPFARLDGYAG